MMRIRNRLLVLIGLLGAVFIAGFIYFSQTRFPLPSQLASGMTDPLENQLVQGFEQARQHFLLIYAILAVTILLLLIAGLIAWVIRPLQRITTSLDSTSTLPIEPMLADPGEFGQIARLMETSFEHPFLMEAVQKRHEQAEKALRESEERYRIFTELSSDAAFSIRLEGDGSPQLEWGGETILRLTGYSHEKLRDFAELQALIYPDDRHFFDDYLQDLSTGDTLSKEVRFFHASGKIRWLRLHFFPVIDPQTQTILRLYGAAQDITAEVDAQEAYHSLVDNSPFGMAIFQDGAIRFCNQVLAHISGYSVEEILGFTPAHITGILHPGDHLAVTESMDAVVAGGESGMREVRLRFKDDQWHWMEVSAVRVVFQDNPALLIAFHDISSRKQAEQDLDQQQQYSSAVLNTVDALVMILEPDGRVRNCNPAGLHILRSDSAELYGKDFWDLFILPPNAPIQRNNFATIVQSRTPIKDIDIWLPRPDGRTWLSWSQGYLLDDDGKVSAVVGTANDISERKIRERQREAIAAIATTVRASSTRRDIAEMAIKAIDDFLQIETVAIGIPDEQAQKIELQFVAGSLKQRLAGQKLPMENSISGDVFRSGKPYLTNDLRSEKNFYTKDLLDTLNAAAWIPMVVDGAVTGVIIVSGARPIDPAEYHALIPIADMAASAIHRASLAEQMQERLQHLTALRAINVSISASFDLRVTLSVLVNQIHSQLGVSAVSVLLLEPKTRLLRYAAGNGFRSRAVEQTNLWLGEGLAGRIALDRHNQYIFDLNGLPPYFPQCEWIAGEEFVAYHAVPMVVKGEVKGVLETFHRAPGTTQNDFMELLEALAMETAIAIDKAELLEMLQRSNQELIIAHDKTIEGWARALELRDQDTEFHTQRVAEWTTRIAQAYGIVGAELMQIRRGALLHDLGKIAVPDAILNKTGPLSENEWKIMRQHPQFAYDMLSQIEFLRPTLDIPYCHHEHWDGSGYPRGLAGEEIPVAARIFSVIDVWDALRNKRPYRDAWPEEKVIAHLEEQAGKQLDPEIVRIFLEIRPLIVKNDLNR